MFFTQDDYKKIRNWLSQNTVKDSQFQSVTKLTGGEQIPLLQGGENKLAYLSDILCALQKRFTYDIYNVTARTGQANLCLSEAIALVPKAYRKPGMIITFMNTYGFWDTWQFKGYDTSSWSYVSNWGPLLDVILENYIYYPDEEDITSKVVDGKKVLKLRDRDWEPEDFSGLGFKILRKNLVNVDDCEKNTEENMNNILTQEMLQENVDNDNMDRTHTIYIVRYDFDLDGKTIYVPEGSTLQFDGGHLYNGTLVLNDTQINGLLDLNTMSEFEDENGNIVHGIKSYDDGYGTTISNENGDLVLQGTFRTGQVMAFENQTFDDFDLDEHSINVDDPEWSEAPRPSAKGFEVVDTTSEKDVRMKYWDGEKWVDLLDISDWQHLKEIFEDFVKQYNTTIQGLYDYIVSYGDKLYEYFSEEISKLWTEINNIDSRITTIEGDITTIKNSINNINSEITNIEGQLSDFGASWTFKYIDKDGNTQTTIVYNTGEDNAIDLTDIGGSGGGGGGGSVAITYLMPGGGTEYSTSAADEILFYPVYLTIKNPLDDSELLFEGYHNTFKEKKWDLTEALRSFVSSLISGEGTGALWSFKNKYHYYDTDSGVWKWKEVVSDNHSTAVNDTITNNYESIWISTYDADSGIGNNWQYNTSSYEKVDLATDIKKLIAEYSGGGGSTVDIATYSKAGIMKLGKQDTTLNDEGMEGSDANPLFPVILDENNRAGTVITADALSKLDFSSILIQQYKDLKLPVCLLSGTFSRTSDNWRGNSTWTFDGMSLFDATIKATANTTSTYMGHQLSIYTGQTCLNGHSVKLTSFIATLKRGYDVTGDGEISATQTTANLGGHSHKYCGAPLTPVATIYTTQIALQFWGIDDNTLKSAAFCDIDSMGIDRLGYQVMSFYATIYGQITT